MKKFIVTVTLFISYSMLAQVGIGIPNPDASAVLELSSTQKGFLPPRLTTAQRDAINQPAEGLTIFNITKNCLEWYIVSGWYNACGDNGIATVTNYACGTLETGTMITGILVSGVSQTITASVSAPGSYDISAAQNGVTFSARGNFTSIGNHDIILHATGTPLAAGDHDFDLNTSGNTCTFKRKTVTNIPTVTGRAGKTWMAYNLGATAPAAASNDAAQYGDYYQWGRGADGHEQLNAPSTTQLSSTDSPGHGNFIITNTDWRSTTNNNLWQGVNGINNPCPAGFRIPTNQEWNDEFTASGIVDNATAFSSILKLPAPGYRNAGSAAYMGPGRYGYYWSSDTSGSLATFRSLTSISFQNDQKGFGFSVRCIKD